MKTEFLVEAHAVIPVTGLSAAINTALDSLKAKKTNIVTIYDNNSLRVVREYAIVNNHPQLVFCSY